MQGRVEQTKADKKEVITLHLRSVHYLLHARTIERNQLILYLSEIDQRLKYIFHLMAIVAIEVVIFFCIYRSPLKGGKDVRKPTRNRQAPSTRNLKDVRKKFQAKGTHSKVNQTEKAIHSTGDVQETYTQNKTEKKEKKRHIFLRVKGKDETYGRE